MRSGASSSSQVGWALLALGVVGAGLQALHLLIPVLIGLCLVLLLGFTTVFAVRRFNRLVTLQNAVRQHRSDVQVEEQRREDLLENFLNAVRGSLTYESDRLDRVLDAIQRLPVSVVFKLYPELQAVEHVKSLGQQVQSAEDRLAASRTSLNQAVTPYEDARRGFPTNLLLGWRFPPEDYFGASFVSPRPFRIAIPRA